MEMSRFKKPVEHPGRRLESAQIIGDFSIMQYLGHLPASDMLYQYLKYEIQPQLSDRRDVDYRVYRLNGSNAVYLYEDKYSKTRVIGKFFLSGQEHDADAAARRLNRECHHLRMLRDCGFAGSPHYIARPLGCNSGLNQLLVTEFCNGELLSSIIDRAIRTGDHGLLYGKLTALAYFLATLHNRTAQPENRVNFTEAVWYMETLLGRIRDCGLEQDLGEFYHLRDCWRGQPKMWEDASVLVHGDATPENFMHGDGLHVISYDLERLRRADRVFDIGRMAGELAHFFYSRTGSRGGAEPFIGHFLWEYACHFPDRNQAFASITRRVPFYMGLTFLRIARNNWLDWNYRKQLIYEAKICLREFQR